MANTLYHSQLGHTIESLTSETHLLLQLLADWSHGDATKPQIYNGYVNMAMAFAACTYAFEEHGVDMSTARVAPRHIWDQLERMLAMEAAPHTRDIYLPSIQSSAQLLLQDLRAKRRESYQLSRTRKRGSLTSNASSTANTIVEMERERSFLRLDGQEIHQDSRAQHPDVVVLAHRTVSRNSSTTMVSQSNSSTILDALLTCDSGEKYVCAACGTECLEPIQDAVDFLTSNSLELKGLLEKWRQGPALAVNLYLSFMRVSQDYDAAAEVFENSGAYVANLKPTVQELKNTVKKAAHFPYRCGYGDLRTQILSEASNSIERLKSGQHKYAQVNQNRVNYACAVLDRAFKVVISAFYARGMGVSGIVPSSSSELNGALQDLLAEGPSPENWKKHQPAIGIIVKKLLKSVLDLGVGDHMAVEIWWSVVGLGGEDEMSGMDASPTDHDPGPNAGRSSTGTGNSPVTPQVAPPLVCSSPKREEEAPALDSDRVGFGLVPLLGRWGASSVSLLLSALGAHLDRTAVDLPGLEVPNEACGKGGVIGATLRRMSGRIGSMFNLRDVKGRNRRLPA
ncbi:Bud site selection protein 6 [Ceratobasidium sp. 414]|nr:Bud site selection protein 6 [Ceratobasidium sp. 414]